MNPELIDWLAACSKDPVAFVRGAFPWGESDSRLQGFSGPEPWQLEILGRIRDGLLNINQAIQLATASGHGVGKSALVSWIIIWAISTKPDTRGVITANTEAQLKTKTWSELGKWFHMFIAKDLFKLTATAIFSKDESRERTWRIDQVPWSERNTEAFAGLHNQGRRILVLFDEASAIPDIIWETTEGALTDKDTEIIWCVFGNPTRNTGRFKDCFTGSHAEFWRSWQVDSRSVSFTNKDQINKWLRSYGEDSDFVRIRVYGEFPRVGEMEFFNAEDIEAAATRDATIGITDPLALGVDVARYGKNFSVIYPRKGRDARTYERQRYQGIDTTALTNRIFDANFQFHADGIMVDGGGVGGGVVDQLRSRALFCFEVQFGSKDDTPHYVYGSVGERYANKRSGMYGALRAWLRTGMIPNDPALRKQFSSIKYVINKKDEIQLLSKEDMIKLEPDAEFDDIDALALTFAQALQPHENAGGEHLRSPLVEHEYDPIAAFEAEQAA